MKLTGVYDDLLGIQFLSHSKKINIIKYRNINGNFDLKIILNTEIFYIFIFLTSVVTLISNR